MIDSEMQAAASRVLVVSGPPGAGKSTVSRLVAERNDSPAVCMEIDWFWTTITTGFIPPWEPASDQQNQTVLRSSAAAATEMVAGGYHVVVEGVVGPWHLPILVEALAATDALVDYVVLRPDLATCLARAAGRSNETPRTPGRPPLTDSGPVRHLWTQFADLGRFEPHALDTTGLTATETADRVISAVGEGTLAL